MWSVKCYKRLTQTNSMKQRIYLNRKNKFWFYHFMLFLSSLSFHPLYVQLVLNSLKNFAYFLFIMLSLAYRYGTLVTPLLKELFPFLTFMLGLWYPVFHLDILKYNLNDIIIGNVDKKAINWLLWPNCSPGSIFWVDFFWPASMKGILEDFFNSPDQRPYEVFLSLDIPLPPYAVNFHI